ncbi:hypothetical protein GCM10007913_23220 [Devosia yakushimensis]|uniref:Uncharacterized protein n=1 Tax=Devosia yakushimensis TaxID=470028 RepID=A0ABQ5UGQ1_9HYPH|nr:hypothetical protein GCM10007913_23220 [Devosia yakushimensis]
MDSRLRGNDTVSGMGFRCGWWAHWLVSTIASPGLDPRIIHRLCRVERGPRVEPEGGDGGWARGSVSMAGSDGAAERAINHNVWCRPESWYWIAGMAFSMDPGLRRDDIGNGEGLVRKNGFPPARE